MENMNLDTTHLYAVIMAGGRGERFWPSGRRTRPKQLLPLLGRETMIEETVQRLFPLLTPERIFVITNQTFVRQIRELLPIPAENVIGEPAGRDTAPCVALAAALLKRRDPAATMILLSADHVIRPARAFQSVLKAAAERAANGTLVTIGITPNHPATGYGYIHTGEPVGGIFHKVLEFKEKPDKKTAEKFFRDGSYKWNSGIFIWRVDAIIGAFEKYAPELTRKIGSWSETGDFESDFASCPKISIDYAIMEKADNVEVADASFYWNDIGSWSSLQSVLPLDEQGNAVRGNVVALDSANNVLICGGNDLLGVIGMRDIAVVKSGNGILVCPLSEEQRVRELVAVLKKDFQEYL